MTSPTSSPTVTLQSLQARDVLPVAWRVALEFSRPTRNARPWTWAAIVTLPVYLALVTPPGTHHLDHRVVIGVRRQRAGLVRHAVSSLGFLLGALASMFVWTIATVATGWRWLPILVVAVVGAAWSGPSITGWVIRRRRPREGAESSMDEPRGKWRKPFPNVANADWVGSLVASDPLIANALETVVGPFLQQVIPTGETLAIVARNMALAARYRKLGFVPVDHPRQLIRRF